jgi:uncharacterized repeat protein (TIGR03943 family)
LLLLGLGLFLAYLIASGNLGNYVNLRFVWVGAIGAILAILLGVAALSARARVPHADTAGHSHLGHRHGPVGRPALALLAVPLALGLFVPSQPLGAAAVTGEVSFSRGVAEVATITTSDSLEWTVLDWLRMFSNAGQQGRIEGKQADVTGFVYRRSGDPDGYFVISRFLMVHCTADAYAIGMPVAWAGAGTLTDDTWVRVRGTVRVGTFGGSTLPILEATAVDERVDRPSQAYLYP